MKIFKPSSASKNKKFYSQLVQGDCGNYIWGKNNRFSPGKALTSRSIYKYFIRKMVGTVSATDKVLDIGCGNGVFLPIVADMCGEIFGVDISNDMLSQCHITLEKSSTLNSHISCASSDSLPFDSDTFDVIYMVDVLHHVVHVEETVREVYRVLKKEGKCIIFEPNKFNIPLAILCLFDRNEWGALRLGSKRQYKRLFKDLFCINQIEYNGLVIGPDGKVIQFIADTLEHPLIKPFLGWQSPKIFISMTKAEDLQNGK